MSAEEAAEYLDIELSYLYKLTSWKKIKHYKPNGKKLYFLKEDLDNWISSNPVKTEDEIDSEVADLLLEKKFDNHSY
ncbi:MAG: hypothetical protein APR63_14290 [Desulfuromonas sp. SDB]|nr:MAG: hypothetical protein APR63_14290 [Desulfuromonas sp. SDB]